MIYLPACGPTCRRACCCCCSCTPLPTASSPAGAPAGDPRPRHARAAAPTCCSRTSSPPFSPSPPSG
jgi:hypothetical protein